MQAPFLNTKWNGIIVLAVAALFIGLTVSYTTALRDIQTNECAQVCAADMGPECPHAKSIPWQSYGGFTLVLILGYLGVSTILSARRAEKGLVEASREIEEAVKLLKGEEREVYEVIVKAEGALFQSDIVEKTSMSKVKVSRILDKLEGKGLIERRRRGMTNVVLLKRS